MINHRSDTGDDLNGAPILTTKLHIPRVSAKTITRQRLIERINHGMEGKITFLCAPAGFGKSTLLGQWAQQTETLPAWYSIDQADNDPVRFWRYVTAAIDTIRPGFREKTSDAIKLIGPEHYEVAIAMLINELQKIEQSLVLVLDDFHAITNENLLASIAYFIEYLPEHVHLVPASRTEPSFKTARLTSQQWMTRLDTADMRFTLQESKHFYAGWALDLSEEEAGEWMQRTEGWITAMKLAALSQHGGMQSSIQHNFAGASRLIEQYLLEEVFMHQSEEVRRFLLDCSVLKRMSAPLCRAVTGLEQGQSMLERLENEQLFVISLDESNTWYRFHYLFSEFLYAWVERTEPKHIPLLLERAGQWCESEGLREEALDYYISGNHFERAVALFEKITMTSAKIVRASQVWLSAQFSRIPGEILLQHPYLYFSYVHLVILWENDHAKADKMMRFAEQRYESNVHSWTEEARNDFWGTFYFMKTLYALAIIRDPKQAIHFIRLSRHFKPDGPKLIFMQSPNAGHPSFLRERMKREDQQSGRNFLLPFLKQMINMLEEVGMVVNLQTCLAEAFYEYNELDLAKQTSEEAIASAFLGDPSVIPEMLFPARLVLMRIHRAQGKFAAAVETMRSTRRDIIDLGMSRSLVYCDAELALLALEKGDSEPAKEWIRFYRFGDGAEIQSSQLYEYEYLLRILLALERYGEAWQLSGQLLDVAIQSNRFYNQIEISVIRVLLLHLKGRTDDALEQLRSILFTAESRDFVRTFLDAGELMAELLSMLLASWDHKQWEEGPSLGYVRGLLAGSGRSPGKAEDLALILTKKEMDVFRLITRRKTNNEIGTELGIGYGTVRTHINNIYSKLTVTTRSEAIKKGEEFGL